MAAVSPYFKGSTAVCETVNSKISTVGVQGKKFFRSLCSRNNFLPSLQTYDDAAGSQQQFLDALKPADSNSLVHMPEDSESILNYTVLV
jgi:hypothetical protein